MSADPNARPDTHLAERLRAGFADAYGGAPRLTVRAPGRVNLIGEHTDYNDGFALPVAIGMETRVALRASGDDTVRVRALDFGEEDAFGIAGGIAHSGAGGWRDYVRGSLATLAEAGHPVLGADLAIAGTIPKGTGLSSSASLEVALMTAMLALAGAVVEPKQVALLAQRAENDFVGMRCGNLDQIASAATQAGAALLIDCRSLDTRAVPVPADTAILIVQSGIVRGLVEGEYNRRRAECEEAAAELGVAALRDADMAMLAAAQDRMRPVVFRRARHIVTDNARTLEAATALAAGDLAAMGRLMRDSHASQRDDFGITVPGTDALADLMNEAIGEHGGARQTGGGFGGAVVGILEARRVPEVREAILAGYRTPAGGTADIYVEHASAGAGPV